MRAFKNIKELKTVKSENKKSIFSKRKLFTLSSLFCVLLSFSLLGFSLSFFGFSKEVKQITSCWAPNLQDIGKIKFVNGDETMTEKEVHLSVSEMCMPFENSYAIEGEECFLVKGLGSMVVKSCLNGKVTKIENKGLVKNVTISHGKGLVTIYENLDTVGVKEGDSVKKNSPIGISYSSQIVFKILLSGKVVAGLTVKDGEMTFL